MYVYRCVPKMLSALLKSSLILLFAVAIFGDTTEVFSPSDTLLDPPAYVRGIITAHLPLTLFDMGEGEEEDPIWFPGGEFGFILTPTMEFEDYYIEFPLHIQTIPPFLEKYAAIGDVGAGAYFRTWRRWGVGTSYRYLRANYFPSNAIIEGHLWTLDVGVPYRQLRLQGFKFEWLVSGKVEFFGNTTRPIPKYTGSALFITPYWEFELEQGRIQVLWRTMVASKFTGIRRDTGELWQATTPTISTFEVLYTYP